MKVSHGHKQSKTAGTICEKKVIKNTTYKKRRAFNNSSKS